MEFNNYTFSKSFVKISNDEIKYNTIIFTSRILFLEYFNDPDLNLILIKHSKIGFFLTNSEIQLFQTFINHLSYFQIDEVELEEKKTCKIINLPNIVDPRLNIYILEIPKYSNFPIKEWDINLKNIVRELDPFFQEELLLETEILKKEDILVCKLCDLGYIMSENSNTACKRHSKNLNSIYTKFMCCGKNSDQYLDGCKIGYHYSN